MKSNIQNSSRSSYPSNERLRLLSRGRGRGFTIIELMITLTVAAILLAIAIPSFNYLMVTNKLTTTANDVVTAVNTARMTAIKRNTDVSVCTDATCSVNVVAKSAQGSTPAVAAEVVRAGITGVNLPIQMTAPTPLFFSGLGIGRAAVGTTAPYDGLVTQVFTAQISSNNYRCIYLTTGTIVQTCTMSAACPAAVPNPCTN